MVAILKQVKYTLKACRSLSNIGIDKVNPVITISEGKLRGSTDKLYNGTTYYSFKGIPYAQPPIGKLRFKDSKPYDAWTGVRDAINHGPISPQADMQLGTIKDGNEDCLFLNVYTPSLQPDSKIPVIVFIHGGAFIQGSGDSSVYGPTFLLQHDVILVTINYRLEAFGFLSMESPVAPGNAGLKDQVIALRWVQRNISHFGGDPNNVTIFGESAGAASVTYHLLSPMTDGLFHKVIAQSGVCTSDWAIDRDPKSRAFRVGNYFGNDSKSTDELLDFLQTVPAKELITISFKTATEDESLRGLPIHFSPIVEKHFEHIETFLNEDPLKLLKEGKAKKVPIILGYNSSEGLIAPKRVLQKVQILNKHPSYYVPKEVADKISHEKMIEFGKRIKKYYFDNKDLTEEDKELIAKIITDLHFVKDAYRFADYYSESNSPTYMFRFNCVTELNFLKILTGTIKYEGACHSDQLFYTFNNPMNQTSYEEHERLRILIHMVTKLWTDFAKTGNPTPDNSLGVTWLPYTKAKRQYLNIEKKLTMGSNAEVDRLEFWKKIYKEAGV